MTTSEKMPVAGRKNSYDYDELLLSGKGTLLEPKSPRLPKPPMLMFDQIDHISKDGGEFSRGLIEASKKITPEEWFFDCHFEGDPVMPGCLGLDAMWQLIGFFQGWLGREGYGRALGVGRLKFRGQVLPKIKMITYRINVKRLIISAATSLCYADAVLEIEGGKKIYTAEDLSVGVFPFDEKESPF